MTNRVTKAHLESIITDKKFHRLTETLTVCVLTLRNGFTVTGESACVSPETYNQEIGEVSLSKMPLISYGSLRGMY